jgi:hypothetical protein
MALSNAERQRLYIQRLKERAGDPRPKPDSRTAAAIDSKEAKAAWLKVRRERRAYREADAAWRLSFDNLMRNAARGSMQPKTFDGLPIHSGAPRGVEYVKQEAWELFGIRWKP